MRVHLIDGTYELFRQHFGMASRHADRHPYAAAAGVVASTLALVQEGATHVGVASDHVIESFRNDLWPGYKTSAGMDPEILEQIPVMERALDAAGFVVWPMVEHEADDALARPPPSSPTPTNGSSRCSSSPPTRTSASAWSASGSCSTTAATAMIIDEAGVREKFGVGPESIADYLGLVGDTADGFPGLAGWGSKSAALVLARYGHIENIPASAGQWDVPGLRGAPKLSATLQANMAEALLFRRIATVETDLDVGTVDSWKWHGPTDDFADVAAEIGSPDLVDFARRLAPHA